MVEWLFFNPDCSFLAKYKDSIEVIIGPNPDLFWMKV